LNINNPVQKELMDLQRTTQYTTTKSSNYDEIEKAALSAGLLK
jgi:phosphonate transport system substrate-binding protein